MVQENSVVSVFTARGVGRILQEGGSQSWVLDAKRAGSCKYLVCVQNRGFPDDWGQASAPNHEAFLIGKVSKVLPSKEDGEDKGRYIIVIDEYAEISIPNAWPGNRNPVRYTTLEEMGIDASSLKFQPVPLAQIQEQVPEPSKSPLGLSIEEAKKGIALRFGVKAEQVQITING